MTEYLDVSLPQWRALAMVVDRADRLQTTHVVHARAKGDAAVHHRTAQALARRRFVTLDLEARTVRPTLHGRSALSTHLRITARRDDPAPEATANPRWLTQTILHDPDHPEIMGNCWQTCIASLLDIPLDEVPHFAQENENIVEMDAASRAWARDRGYDLLHIDLSYTVGSPMLCILTGRSPRGVQHAVIGRGGQILHDPHPSRAGLAPDSAFIFVPLDPREDRPS